MAARWGAFSLVSDGSWLRRRSPAQRETTARLSLQLDFQEHVDAAADDRSWITNPTPPTGWAIETKHAAAIGDCTPFARPPWDAVEPRGIPLLREEEVVPARVVSRASGACAEGWRGWENIAWPWVTEAKAAAWATADDGRRGERWLELDLPAAGADGCLGDRPVQARFNDAIQVDGISMCCRESVHG